MAEHTEPDVRAIDQTDDDDDDLDIPDDLAFGFAVDKESKTYIVDDVDHGALSAKHKERLQSMTRMEYEQCLSLADAVADGGGPKITTTVMKNAHEIAPLASGPSDYLNMLAAYGDKVRDKHHDGQHNGMVMKTARQALKEECDCKLYAMQQVHDMQPDAHGVYPSVIKLYDAEPVAVKKPPEAPPADVASYLSTTTAVFGSNITDVTLKFPEEDEEPDEDDLFAISMMEDAPTKPSALYTQGSSFATTRTLTPEEVELRKMSDEEIRAEMRKVEATYQTRLVGLRAEQPRPYRGLAWCSPVERAAIKKGIKCLEALEEAREAEMRMQPLPEPPKEVPKIDETAPKYQGEKGKALLKVDKRQRVYDMQAYNEARKRFGAMAADEEAARKKHKQAAFRAMKVLARFFPRRGGYLRWCDAAEEAMRTKSVPKRDDQGQKVLDDHGKVVMEDVPKPAFKVVDAKTLEARNEEALQAYEEERQVKHREHRKTLIAGILEDGNETPHLANSMQTAMASKSSSKDWQQYQQRDRRILSSKRRATLDEAQEELEVVSDQAVKDQLQKEQDAIAARKAAPKPVLPWCAEEAAMNEARVDELKEIAKAVEEGRYEEYKEMMQADAIERQIKLDEAELDAMELGCVDYFLQQMKIRTDRWKHAKSKLPIKHAYAKKNPPVLKRPSFFNILQHGLPKRTASNADDVFATASAGEGAVTLGAGPSKRARK